MKTLTLDGLLAMGYDQLFEVLSQGNAIPEGSLDDTQYRGVDLSLPKFMNKILWKTFRKTFHRDTKTGVLRGWNVRMQQTGWDGPGEPMTKAGKPITFGHYHFASAEGVEFPRGWTGPHYLNYGVAGNPWYDPARFGYTPLVAVNAGSAELLLGWEIMKFGPARVTIPDFWALRREGPLEDVVEPPRRM